MLNGVAYSFDFLSPSFVLEVSATNSQRGMMFILRICRELVSSGQGRRYLSSRRAQMATEGEKETNEVLS